MDYCNIAALFLSLIPSSSLTTANPIVESVLAQENQHDIPSPSAHTIHHILEKAKIIPNIMDDFNPLCYLTITYPTSHVSVSLGNKILPNNTQTAPVVEVSCPSGFGYHSQGLVSGAELMAEDELLESESRAAKNPPAGGMELGPFTLVLTDPDAPSRRNPKWSEMCHWIAALSTPVTSPSVSSSSVSFEMPQYMEIGSPMDILPYKAPGPPPQTGYHRYVFLLFSGDNSNLTVPTDRKNWGMGKKGKGVKQWAKSQGLQVVGANFFYARHKEQ